MANEEDAKFEHLSYDERLEIEKGLKEGKPVSKIAESLGRNHSTIIREIKNYKYSVYPNTFNMDSKTYAANLELHCPKLDKSPHVCNACPKKSSCRYIKWYYHAKDAERKAASKLSSSREGIALTPEKRDMINDILNHGVSKGQPIYHIWVNHPEMDISLSSLYRYLKMGAFDVGPLELHRMVRYRVRKKYHRRTEEEREFLIGRTYDDFKKLLESDPDLNIVEMDTVEGLMTDSKCIMTLMWRNTGFMLMFLLKSQTKAEVTRIFGNIQKAIPKDVYEKLFSIILTDRGHEFYDVKNIEEYHKTGEKVTSLYFCDAMHSWQKGRIEKNHEFIRYILPKIPENTSFENLTQKDCDKIASNINSTIRESLNNKTPYEAMLFSCDENILNTLGVYRIDPDDVQLNPELLKK